MVTALWLLTSSLAFLHRSHGHCSEINGQITVFTETAGSTLTNLAAADDSVWRLNASGCLEACKILTGEKQLLDKDPSSKLWFKQCLSRDAFLCSNGEFTREPQRIAPGQRIRSLSVPSLDQCLDRCIGSSQNGEGACGGVSFYERAGGCELLGPLGAAALDTEYEDFVDLVRVHCPLLSQLGIAFHRPSKEPRLFWNHRTVGNDCESVGFLVEEDAAIDAFDNGRRAMELVGTLQECQRLCIEDASCQVATYYGGGCTLMNEQMAVGKRVSRTGARLLAKVCSPCDFPTRSAQVPHGVRPTLTLGARSAAECVEKCAASDSRCEAVAYFHATAAPNCFLYPQRPLSYRQLNLQTSWDVISVEAACGGETGGGDYPSDGGVDFPGDYTNSIVDEYNIDNYGFRRDAPQLPVHFQPLEGAPRCREFRFLRMGGVGLRSGWPGTVERSTLPDCQLNCAIRSSCTALLFSPSRRACVYLTEGLDEVEVVAEAGSEVQERLCLDDVGSPLSEAGERCKGDGWTVEHGRRFLGITEAIVHAKTLKECVRSCLDARQVHGFSCRSGSLDAGKGRCFLHSESAEGQPELLIPHPRFRHFTLPCAQPALAAPPPLSILTL